MRRKRALCDIAISGEFEPKKKSKSRPWRFDFKHRDDKPVHPSVTIRVADYRLFVSVFDTKIFVSAVENILRISNLRGYLVAVMNNGLKCRIDLEKLKTLILEHGEPAYTEFLITSFDLTVDSFSLVLPAMAFCVDPSSIDYQSIVVKWGIPKDADALDLLGQFMKYTLKKQAMIIESANVFENTYDGSRYKMAARFWTVLKRSGLFRL